MSEPRVDSIDSRYVCGEAEKSEAASSAGDIAAGSHDGSCIASASGDRFVRWHVESGREVGTLTGHGAEAVGVAFGPTGEWLVSAGFDNRAVLWRLRQPE